MLDSRKTHSDERKATRRAAIVDGAVQVLTNGTQLVAGDAAIVCQLAIGLRSVLESASLLIAEFAPI